MANDGSIASQVEDWIVAQIQAIQVDALNVFEAAEVGPWNGTQSGDVKAFAAELFANSRDLVARVFYARDSVVTLEAGDIRRRPQFVVLVGIANKRPAVARRGDADYIGTNRIAELLKEALHNKQPMDATPKPITNGPMTVDLTNYVGSEVVLNDFGRCIQQTIIEVDQSTSAT